MSIENIAQNFEREAQRNPESAAADMKLLSEVAQQRILNQMQKDADDPNHQANMSVERDNSGNIKALHFTPLFHESSLGPSDGANRL